jgi:hypothetical protein
LVLARYDCRLVETFGSSSSLSRAEEPMWLEGTIQQDLVQFLNEDLGLRGGDYDLQTPLFSSGLLDSFGLAALLAFAELHFQVRLTSADVTEENVDTVAAFSVWLYGRLCGDRRRAAPAANAGCCICGGESPCDRA